MDEKVKDAMQVVVDYLDDLMTVEPTRTLADASNFLQKKLDEGE